MLTGRTRPCTGAADPGEAVLEQAAVQEPVDHFADHRTERLQLPRELQRARSAIAAIQILYAVFAVLSAIPSVILFLRFSASGALGIAAGCWVAVGVISSAGRTLHRCSDEGARQAAMADRRRSRAATRRTHRRMA